MNHAVFLLMFASILAIATPSHASADAKKGICDRNPRVVSVILETVKKKCAKVLPADLAKVKTLHFWSSTGALRATDFEGLSGVELLILQELSEDRHDEAVFRHLTGLQTISIHSPGAMPKRWTEGIEQLTNLEFGSNSGEPVVSGFPYEDLNLLPKLKQLFFSSMIVDLSKIGTSFDVSRIQRLSITSSTVTGLNAQSMAHFASLKHLLLADVTFDDSLFAGIPGLESLSLGVVNFTYSQNWARTLPRLKNLELRGYESMDATDVIAKSGLSELDKLSTTDQQWSCPVVNPFKDLQINTFEFFFYTDSGISEERCKGMFREMRKSVKNCVPVHPGP